MPNVLSVEDNEDNYHMLSRHLQQALLSHLRHELCTPINAIVGYSEILLDELKFQPDSQLVYDLEKIYSCGNQLLALINANLDPARLEASQLDRDLNRFGSTLRLELLTPLSTVIGYCEMLLEEASDDLIPDLERIQAAAKRLLSMVNDIVNLAAQQLQSLEANRLDTAELAFSSPTVTSLMASAATTIRSLDETESWESVEGGTILVVDDNETNCDLLKRQLERQGYMVTTVLSGQEALKQLPALPYDLILLDIIMPEMSGLEVLHQIKSHQQWRQIPVIMISALDEVDTIVKCIELGADDYLYKPFDPTLLKARIIAHEEKKRLREQELVYLQQVERLTTAAAEVEANTFDPETLADLAQRGDQLGQLARGFQRMVEEVNSREQRLTQQVEMLQLAVDEADKDRLVTEIVETEHFQQLQKRTTGSWEDDQIRDSVDEVSFSPLSDRITALSQIVSIHSYRGGTGKSNLIANLATSIASQGLRVGIVDTDIQSPGIHILFGLDQETIDQTLNDYLWGYCNIREAAYDVSHVLKQGDRSANGSIYLIPSSIKTHDITRIVREGYDEAMLINGLRELIRDLKLDYLLIDTHPGVNEDTLLAITVSSLVVMILRPDYQDYQGTAVTLELARILAVSKMLLVVNKALPISDREAFEQQLEATYNVPVAGILPLCEEMAHLASSDIFCLRYPNHPWTQALQAIANQIIS
jgi:MinD-like ATPase involved in chromosome partitioning or flagellar assembly/DNA-binding response OmpR family regulator